MSEHLVPSSRVLFEEGVEPLGGSALWDTGVSFQFTISWCVDEMLLTSFLFLCPAIMDSNTLEL